MQKCLQELITQSQHLKVALDGPEKLKSILNVVNRWVNDTSSLLEQSKALLYVHRSDIITDSLFTVKVEELLSKINSAIETGVSLGLELNELPKLHQTHSMLQWTLRALSFCSRIPSYDVRLLSLMLDIITRCNDYFTINMDIMQHVDARLLIAIFHLKISL